jgi:Effector-associated domain 1
MARLNGDDFKAWVTAFQDAFDDLDTFGRLVYIASDGKSLDLIAGNDSLENLIPAVIRKADGGGWLKRLLDEALEMQGDRQRLRALRSDLETMMLIEPDSPFDAMRIFGDAMFDRADLRAKLRGLQSDAVTPVLVVYGERYSGKTWSTRLISYIAHRNKELNLVLVDLEPKAGEPVDAALMGQLIAEEVTGQLNAEERAFKGPPPPNEEQDAQWSRQYFTWLARNARQAGGTWWIVIDHLEKVVLSQSAKDFLCGLGREIPTRVPMVRLVILSYHAPDELESGVGRVETEYVPILTLAQLRQDLARFFAIELLSRQRASGDTLNMAALQAKVASSTEAVLGKLTGDDPRRMVTMTEALRQELKRIAS